MQSAQVYRRHAGRILCPTICLLGLLGLLGPGARAQRPVQYCFEVGDHAVYERRAVDTSLATGQTTQRVVDQIQLWCLKKEGDQALILLDLIHIVDGRVEPIRGVLFHMDNRGRCRMPDLTPARAYEMQAAFEVIPVLRKPLQKAALWHTPPDLLGLGRRCTLVGPDEQRDANVRIDFAVTYPGSVGELLGRSRTGRCWFDPEARLVTRVESVEEDRLADRRSESTIVLRLRERKPLGWIRRRADESRRYFMTLRHEHRLLGEVVGRPEQLEQTLERLHRLWSGRLQEFAPGTGAPFDLLARARRKHLATAEDGLCADAEYARRWLNRPAVPWSLQTFSGETLTSEEVRDRPVIECLWSTAAPGFVATLTALDKLRQQAGESIRIVCLNLDSDANLARRVLEELPPGLTHVLAGPLRAVDRPPRVPIVRVLDQRGVIRRLWIGWEASYGDALEEATRWRE